MSMMFEYNNTQLTFEDYCTVSEALNPKETKYGTNYPYFDNREFSKRITTQTTWFLDGNILYWVWMDSLSEISFMKYTNKDLSAYLDTNWYVMDKSTPTNAIRIFSNIFYLALELANTFNRQSIFFKGFSTQLDKLYKLLSINKIFLNTLQNLGWMYVGENEELKHEFIKSKNIKD